MKNSKGFLKLKGLASMGAIGLTSVVGGVSVRAGGGTTTTGFNISTGSAKWSNFGNNTSFPSTGNVTTTNGDVYSSSNGGGKRGSGTEAFCYADATVFTPTSVGRGGSSTSYSDAFDCTMILAVNGNLFINPDDTVDLTGNTVTSDVMVDITPAINAQVQYRVYSERRLVRGLFTLTNTGPGPIFLNAAIMGDYGSDSNTRAVISSDFDATIEASDLWFITDDDGNGDAIVTTSRHGVDAEVTARNAYTPSSNNAVYVSRYPVDIAAGATIRIMTFHEIGPNQPGVALDQAFTAKDLESMTALEIAGLIDDLDQSVRDSVVNFGDSDIIFKNGFEFFGFPDRHNN